MKHVGVLFYKLISIDQRENGVSVVAHPDYQFDRESPGYVGEGIFGGD